VEFIQGDITDLEKLKEACEGVDTVFMCAALVDYWSRLDFQYEKIYRVNFKGSQCVADACVAKKVRRLCYTSSGSVILPENILEKPLVRVTEAQAPIVKKGGLCHYSMTKAMAEEYVLNQVNKGTDSKDEDGLLVTAIRPGGIWGPRDQMISYIFAADETTRGIGGPKNAFDYNYVENVVHALFCAENKLENSSSPCNGKAYFIADEDPAPTYFDWNIAMCSHFKTKFVLLPQAFVSFLTFVSETVTKLSRGSLTPYLGDLAKVTPPVLAFSRSTWTMNAAAARAELGWTPLYPPETSMEMTAKFWDRVKSNASRKKDD